MISLQNDPSHYSGPWLYMGADCLQIAVAEPSAYAVTLFGLGLLALVARRTKKNPA